MPIMWTQIYLSGLIGMLVNTVTFILAIIGLGTVIKWIINGIVKKKSREKK